MLVVVNFHLYLILFVLSFSAQAEVVHSTGKTVLNKKTFFITTWAYGARSVMVRVFDPKTGLANPVCTALSDSYDPQVRVANKYLEIEEVVSELNMKPVAKWKKCISFSGI